MKNGLKQTVKIIIFLAIALLLLWVSFRGINFNNLWQILKKAHYGWLLPATSMTLISFFIRARRWTLLAEPLGYKPKLMNAYHAIATGYLVNLIFPRLGEVTKCATLSEREKIPFDKLVGTMLIERTVDILTVLVIFGLTLIAGSTLTGSFLSDNVVAPVQNRLSSSLSTVIIVSVLIIGMSALAIMLFIRLREKLSERKFFKKIYTFFDGIADGLKSIARLKRKWEFILYTVLLWVAYLFMTYFPLLCLDSTSELGLRGGLFVLVIGSFGMAAPVQNGMGAFHWIVSRGLLVAFGIPLEEGLASATLLHESQMVIVTIFGALSFLILFGMKRGRVLFRPGKNQSV
ncbi:MAG: lysylphosphatidylglycerol synthase transmembrane domain-containing protein [Bacteroidales bacterium]